MTAPNHLNTFKDNGMTKHYILDAKKVQNPVKNKVSSKEENVNEEYVLIQNDAPVLEERIKQDSVKSNESNEWLDSAEVEDIFTDTKAKYTLSEEDNFFSSGFEQFDESPKVSIEAVGELPLCLTCPILSLK